MSQTPVDSTVTDKQLVKILGISLAVGVIGFIIMSLFPYKGPIKLLPASMAFIVFALLIYRQPKSE